LKIGTEESLFVSLNKSLGEDSYMFQMRYYLFSSTLPSCETVNLDLAIAPISKSEARIKGKETTCQSTLSSANALPLAQTRVIQVDQSTGFTYTPSTKFAIARTPTPPGI